MSTGNSRRTVNIGETLDKKGANTWIRDTFNPRWIADVTNETTALVKMSTM